MADDDFVQQMHLVVAQRAVGRWWHRVPLSGDSAQRNEIVAYVAMGYVGDELHMWFAAPATTKMTAKHMTREMGRVTPSPEHSQRVDWALMSGGEMVAMPSEEEIEAAVVATAKELAEGGPVAVFALLQGTEDGARTLELWHPRLVSTEVMWRLFKAAAKRAFG